MSQVTLSHDQMVREVRKYLMKVCKEGLKCRWELWRKIINEETDKINRKLFGEIGSDIFEAKLSKKHMQTITKFIKNWHGLKIAEPSKLPKHMKQYKEKARSWLNGRRAMQYSRNFYPIMIQKAHKFTIKLSQTYFMSMVTKMDNYDKISDNDEYIDNLKQDYIKILMSSYIVNLCQVKMTLNERSKKVFLLCPNSIKSKKSLTRKALQELADPTDQGSNKYKAYMPYYKDFPVHRNMARDYFDKKGENTLQELQNKLRRLKDQEITDIVSVHDDNNDNDDSHSSSSSYHPQRPQLQEEKSNSKSVSMEYPPLSISPSPSWSSSKSSPKSSSNSSSNSSSINFDPNFVEQLLNDIKSTEKNGRVIISLSQLQSITNLLEHCEQSYNQTQTMIDTMNNSTNNINQCHQNYYQNRNRFAQSPPTMDLDDDIHQTQEIINISSDDDEQIHDNMTIDNDPTEIDWPENESLFQGHISDFMNYDYNCNDSIMSSLPMHMPFEYRSQSINPSVFHLSHSSYGMFE